MALIDAANPIRQPPGHEEDPFDFLDEEEGTPPRLGPPTAPNFAQGNGRLPFEGEADQPEPAFNIPGEGNGNLDEQFAAINLVIPPIKYAPLPPAPQKIEEEPKPEPKINDLELIGRLKVVYPLEERGFLPGPPSNFSTPPKWYYVNSKVFRAYQFEITRKCLVANTLVCLPTGLGKTFISLNVIINFHRWYPTGMIFFLAPTKPLVSQQIDALRDVGRIPNDLIAHLDGTTAQHHRQQAYLKQRIFFMTPQTMENDMAAGLIDRYSIVLLVLDEAHRGTGKYAYSEIVRTLTYSDVGFRIVALTATPANTFADIQQIISNLAISNIEIRRDDDLDVRKYLQTKKLTPIIVSDLGRAARLADYLTKVIQWIWVILKKNLTGKDEQQIFSRHPEGKNYFHYKMVNESFKSNRKFYRDLYQEDGIGSLFTALSAFLRFTLTRKKLCNQGFEVFKIDYEKLKKKFLTRAYNHFLRELTALSYVKNLENEYRNFLANDGADHPKMTKLFEIMKDFSVGSVSNQRGSKCIIFTGSRSNAHFIKKAFEERMASLPTRLFVGQHHGGKDDATKSGMSQKLQLEILRDFRAGKIQVLIATCVAEEGLDVAEVDLIVCYDSGLNPTRLLQRMGRTGRRREGHIFLLLTPHESEKYFASLKQYDNTVEELKNTNNEEGEEAGASFKFFEKNSRMVPSEIKSLELEMLLQLENKAAEELSDQESREDPDEDEHDPEEKERKRLEAEKAPPKEKRVSKKTQIKNEALTSMKMTHFFKPADTLPFYSPKSTEDSAISSVASPPRYKKIEKKGKKLRQLAGSSKYDPEIIE